MPDAAPVKFRVRDPAKPSWRGAWGVTIPKGTAAVAAKQAGQTKPDLLIVDDDPLITDTLNFVLSRDFTVYVADSRARADFLAADLLAKGPVMNEFWATWGKPCKRALPSMERLQQKHGARGLTGAGRGARRQEHAEVIRANLAALATVESWARS